MDKIKVMIAEDHKIFRETLKTSLPETSPRIKVIGASENGKELLEAINKNTPDVLLLDIYMPEMTGWEVLKILKAQYSEIKVVMFSGEFDQSTVGQAILSGAHAFIDKWKADQDEVIAAIESVYDYGYYFNDIVSQEIIIALKTKVPMVDQRFSEREKEVMNLICQGKQVKEIAESLHISPSTVKRHKESVYKKTVSETKMDLLKYAISRGIYNIDKTTSNPYDKKEG